MTHRLSNHARGLAKDVQERYIKKISVLSLRDPYILMKDQCIQWINSLDLVPEVTYPDIFNYLVLTKSAYTLDEFKAFKSLEAYNFLLVGGFITLNGMLQMMF